MRLFIEILLGVAVALLGAYAASLVDDNRLLRGTNGALNRSIAWWTERCEKYQERARDAEAKVAKRRKRVKR